MNEVMSTSVCFLVGSFSTILKVKNIVRKDGDEGWVGSLLRGELILLFLGVGGFD